MGDAALFLTWPEDRSLDKRWFGRVCCEYSDLILGNLCYGGQCDLLKESVDYQDDMQFEVTVDLIRIVLLP